MRSIPCDDLKKFYEKAINEKGHKESENYSVGIGKEFKERGYLKPLEVFYFICWKSPYRAKIPNNWLFELINTQENVERVTHDALELVKEDKVKESVEELIKLKGVKVRTASAILTFYDTNNFGAVDKFAWKNLYGEDKNEFNSDDYLRYLKDIRTLAKNCGMKAREVDLALYTMK